MEDLSGRENAAERIALREKIEALGDPDLTRLIEERDMLAMERDEGREIRSEWAALARQIAPHTGSNCVCDVCAIGRALDLTVSRV